MRLAHSLLGSALGEAQVRMRLLSSAKFVPDVSREADAS
jgi:hypothetical protein